MAEDAVLAGDIEPAQTPVDDLPDDVRDEIREEIASQVRERSELLGFWLAWHLAGGFRQLEAGGWHRATIFRKIRDFRDTYGAHPDEMAFDWLRLDLRTYWRSEVRNNFRTPFSG